MRGFPNSLVLESCLQSDLSFSLLGQLMLGQHIHNVEEEDVEGSKQRRGGTTLFGRVLGELGDDVAYTDIPRLNIRCYSVCRCLSVPILLATFCSSVCYRFLLLCLWTRLKCVMWNGRLLILRMVFRSGDIHFVIPVLRLV
jgi:hypothetical protein